MYLSWLGCVVLCTLPLPGGRIYNTVCTLEVAGHPSKVSDDDILPYNGYMDQVGRETWGVGDYLRTVLLLRYYCEKTVISSLILLC